METYPGSPATAGPNGDGSKSLSRESKFGNLVHGGLVVLALYVAEAAGKFDLTPLPDVIEPVVVAAVTTAAGLLTSWATRNRVRRD